MQYIIGFLLGITVVLLFNFFERSERKKVSVGAKNRISPRLHMLVPGTQTYTSTLYRILDIMESEKNGEWDK